MCGRYTVTKTGETVADLFDAALDGVFAEALGQAGPRYNVAPTQEAPVIVAEGSKRRLAPMCWGLLRDRSAKPQINARSETAAQLPTFSTSLRQRRCLVPADGFFEWKRLGQRSRQPHWIHLQGRPLFAFAGLWSPTRSERGNRLPTFSILTTSANSTVAPLHDRMPVILPQTAYSLWLDPNVREPGRLAPLCEPRAPEGMAHHPVSDRVNRVEFDDDTLIEPTAERPPEPTNLPLF